MKMTIVLLVALLFLPTLSIADYNSGNDIMDLWNDKYREGNSMVRGYFAGVQDAYNGNYFCVPPKVTMGQAAEIIIKYMKENPDKWHEAGKILIIDAIRNAFSCKNKSNKAN